MATFADWLHHLFNPHCPHCEALERERIARERESEICNTCEVLKLELAQAHDQVRELQEAFIAPKKIEEPKVPPDIKPILPARLSWRARQQMLEREDRHAAELIKEKQKNGEPTNKSIGDDIIEDLEKEMDIAGDETRKNVEELTNAD